MHGSADQLEQSVHEPSEVAFGQLADPGAKPLRGERTHLRDFDPRWSRQDVRRQVPGEQEPRSLQLTCDREGDDRPATRIEEIVADDDDGTDASLLMSTYRLQVGPVHFASQDVGHGVSAT